jgi:glycosyltransferase involved in cell wall biosynthesis
VTATTALVIETDNLLAIESRSDAIVAGLEQLLSRLAAGALPLARLDEVVLVHEGLPLRDQATLSRAAGRPLRFVEVPRGSGYYAAKNAGFAATTADVVAFGDADCRPSDVWLHALLGPMRANGDVQVVAGRTVYEPSALGDALTAIDFQPIASPLGRGCVRHFFANNVAFRREVFAARPFELREDLHRGACGVLALRLHRDGIPIHHAPDALTVHRTPRGLELVERRMKRGSDLARLAPEIARAHLPAALAWVGQLGPLSPLVLLAGRLVVATGVIAGHRRPGALARASLALRLTALDACGALAPPVTP